MGDPLFTGLGPLSHLGPGTLFCHLGSNGYNARVKITFVFG